LISLVFVLIVDLTHERQRFIAEGALLLATSRE
jgi:hypothetical protein